jgi:hypothetical protein
MVRHELTELQEINQLIYVQAEYRSEYDTCTYKKKSSGKYKRTKKYMLLIYH